MIYLILDASTTPLNPPFIWQNLKLIRPWPDWLDYRLLAVLPDILYIYIYIYIYIYSKMLWKNISINFHDKNLQVVASNSYFL